MKYLPWIDDLLEWLLRDVLLPTSSVGARLQNVDELDRGVVVVIVDVVAAREFAMLLVFETGLIGCFYKVGSTSYIFRRFLFHIHLSYIILPNVDPKVLKESFLWKNPAALQIEQDE